MRLIQDNDLELNRTCIAFGYFDSMHKGHRSVISRLIEQESKGFSSVLVCFERNKHNASYKGSDIYSKDEKTKLIEKNGPMFMVYLPFDEAIATMEPEEFIKEVLMNRFGAKAIVAGNNCRFGKYGSGNIQTLKELSDQLGYELICCDTVNHNDQEITNDWIYHEIITGKIETANELLGHQFTLWGEIVHGKAIGRNVGMPTANLRLPENKLLPKHGVYATLSEIDGEWIQGLTNIGQRPSVDNQTHITVETFLLDFSKDIYGKNVRLELHHYIRGVKKFKNLEEVKQQVKLDLTTAKNWFNA